MGVFILSDELDAIGTERYGLAEAMLFTLLSLPRYLYQLFPIATLIGALIGLGTLASRSELVAMRAAGVSVAQSRASALLGGLLLATAGCGARRVVAPIAEQRGWNCAVWRSRASGATHARWLLGHRRWRLCQHPRDPFRHQSA
jgi:lipopolysaccharide export system permease protein